MKVEEISLKGCFLISPSIFEDERGVFFESFNLGVFKKKTGISKPFVQDNISKSKKGVLRGLHFQKGIHAQSKLISVLKGSVLDVCVDLRVESATYGEHFSVVLDDVNCKQLYIPGGFAHGFLTLEENTLFSYKCDNFYNKEAESGIIFNDDTLNINWNFPEENLIISDKDRLLPTFKH
ncbi:dTDP-4-dehydrorhamnose 3,5-epimerase [Postechiella marina]|uniref:dTDP-4-dehydrorhamnose 3,5-epimerase n=1 Tax=Postechiella marina TaxID=943941 RepID=A0ABP8C5F8_9FLAO